MTSSAFLSADASPIPPRGLAIRWMTVAVLILAPLAFGALALALGQDANWDLRNYHWYNAYAFLHGRYTTDILPSQTPFFFNPTLDVPYYLLATHVSARTASFILGTVQGQPVIDRLFFNSRLDLCQVERITRVAAHD